MKVEIINELELGDVRNIKNGFVVTGDNHLYNYHPYNNFSNVTSSRLNDITKALYLAAREATALNIPLIINGDLIHTGMFDYPVLLTVTKFLHTFRHLQIFINTGNHDINAGYSILPPLIYYGRNLNHVAIDGMLEIPLNKKLNLVFISYMNKADTLRVLKQITEEKVNYERILFIHNIFSSSKFSNDAISSSGINPRLALFKKFKLIVASDIHKYQTIMKGRGFYTSSIIPLNFGERSKEHGFHIIDLDKDIRYFVIPDAPKFKQFSATRLTMMSDSKLKKEVEDNFIKIIMDIKNLDKIKIQEKLIGIGARFVIFTRKQASKKTTANVISIRKETNKSAIVSKYSKGLAKKQKLDERRVEKTGIKILLKAESKYALS